MATQDITGVTYFLNCLVQRSTTQFGFNNSPTTVDLDLIQDPANGYTFDYNAALPGTMQRFRWGSLDFVGLVQSYNQTYGPEGEVFNVKLADPRIVLDSVPVILNKYVNVPSGFNMVSLLPYYATPQAADLIDEGMTFRNIRDGIQVTGFLNLFDNRFRIQFTGGFANSKIPAWYRPNQLESSLLGFCQQASEDFGMDYWANIDSSTYNSTGINNLVFNTIDRTQSTTNSISGLIAGWSTSGIVQRFNIGKELRSDPTTSLVVGTNYTKWDSPVEAQGKYNKSYWGRADDGSALFHYSNPAGGYYPLEADRELTGYGIVPLTNILGDYALSKLSHASARITYEKITISKVANTGQAYPPQITRVVQVGTTTGYYPSNNIMRAALYSQEAFEAVLFNENTPFASSVLSIYSSPFIVATQFVGSTGISIPLTNVSGISFGYNFDRRYNDHLIFVGNNTLTRSENSLALSNAVYEATRQAAENYLGKNWICDLPSSTFLNTGSYSSTELIPSIEYQTRDSAWAASGNSIPSGIGSHSSLFYSTDTHFRNTNGDIKAFVSFDNYDNTSNSLFYYNATAAGLPFSLSSMDSHNYLVDYSQNIVFPLSVQQYELDPTRAIVGVDSPIVGEMPVVGLYNGNAYLFPPGTEYFGNFLLALGFDPLDIKKYKLLSHADENKQYGLSLPRINKIVSDGTSQGIFIPLEYKYNYWGPFTSSSGTRNGGVNVITDSSLSPSLYGSYSNFSNAANDIAQISVANATYVEAGDFTLVGLPLYNIGDPIGSNNIVSISTQIGINGITTSYSLRSFALPSIRVSRVISQGKSSPVFIKQTFNNEKPIIIGDNTLEAFKGKLSRSFKGFNNHGSLLWNGPGVQSFNWLVTELINASN